jgi:hypothetical protein
MCHLNRAAPLHCQSRDHGDLVRPAVSVSRDNRVTFEVPPQLQLGTFVGK